MTCKGDDHVFYEPGECECGKRWLQANGKVRDYEEAGK